ncbi:hypothetical protein EI94DRAFT_676253 [Lactarius quietus]|nr:hypothetical protein EI94DRAFT_676253 [Lactarius quietus]
MSPWSRHDSKGSKSRVPQKHRSSNSAPCGKSLAMWRMIGQGLGHHNRTHAGSSTSLELFTITYPRSRKLPEYHRIIRLGLQRVMFGNPTRLGDVAVCS